jgi:hypothetical protein
MPALHDRLAMPAEHRHPDGRPRHRAVGQLVVQRARQDARRGGLADPANACEDPGLRNASGLERIRDGPHHRVLSDQIVEIGRAIFPGQHAIAAAGRGRAEVHAALAFIDTRGFAGFVHRAIRDHLFQNGAAGMAALRLRR